MVSEQIRKSGENGDEDAVETQDSGSPANGSQTIDEEPDKKTDETSADGFHPEFRVQENGKTIVSSATSSRTRIPAASPPQPPGRATKLTPPPRFSKNAAVKPIPDPDPDRDTDTWAPRKHDTAQFEGGLNDIDELGLNNSTVSSEDSLDLPTINVDLPLDGLDDEFSFENQIDERKGLLNLANGLDDANPQPTPAAVATSEPIEGDEDTGEMPAIKSDPENKVLDLTAPGLQEVSEVELESQPIISDSESTSVNADQDMLMDRDSSVKPAPDLVPTSDSDAERETQSSVLNTETDAGSPLGSDQPEDSPHDGQTTEPESVTTESGTDTLNQDLEVETNSTYSSIDSESVVLAESIISEQNLDGIPSSEFDSELEEQPLSDPEPLSLNTDTSEASEILSFVGADFLNSVEPEVFELPINTPELTEIEMPQEMTLCAPEQAPPAVSDSSDSLLTGRNLSSLVAKGKNERATQSFPLPTESTKEVSPVKESQESEQQNEETAASSSVDLSSTEANVIEDAKVILPDGDFEVGPPVVKAAGKSKFASLLAPSLGETTSMREIMESEVVPKTETFTGSEPTGFDFGGPKPAFDFLASPPEIDFLGTRADFGGTPSAIGFGEMPPEPAFLKTDNTVAMTPEPTGPSAIAQTGVVAEPVAPPPPPPPEPSPLGADGLPEPWLNLGKMLKDGKKDDKTSTGTTSSTRTFSTNAPRSTSEDSQMISATDSNDYEPTEQDMPKSEILANENVPGPPDLSVSGSAADEVSTSPVSSQQHRRLGALQRTSTNETSWTPPALVRSSTDWDIVPPSEQDFTRVFQEEQNSIKPLLEDRFITPETAEEVFLKGDVIEACRQYHVLIERMENNPKPNISQMINWSEALADLYILMDEPAHAVSFYHKARTLASDSEPRRVQKYLSCLLKLSTRYEEDGSYQNAEKIYLEAIKVAGDELDGKDVLHQRINDAYVQHSKHKLESNTTSKTAAIEEQCTTLRMRAVKGTDKAFSPTRKPSNVKEIFEETKLEKAAQAERPKRATVSELEFNATKNLEALSGHPLMRVLNSMWIQCILGVILTMCGVACVVSLNKGERTATTSAVKLSGDYKTADSLKGVSFQDAHKLVIWDLGETRDLTYRTVSGNPDDLLDLLRGHLHSTKIFYTLADDRLIDEEGRYLYGPMAPELSVVKYMWWNWGFASWHYKEKHYYPTTTKPWNKITPQFTYVNPVTGKPNTPTITSLTGAANKMLPLVVASGQLFQGEPPPTPGAIRNVCFDKVRYFVRGYDRDSKIICGHEPGQAFAIEASDGENVTQKYLSSFGGNSKPVIDKRPVKLVIITQKSSNLASTYRAWTTIAPVFVLSFLFISLAVAVIAIVMQKRVLRWYHYVSTSLAVLMTIGWFMIALQRG
jgi:tetratricopeptide (TPR) repeat protein